MCPIWQRAAVSRASDRPNGGRDRGGGGGVRVSFGGSGTLRVLPMSDGGSVRIQNSFKRVNCRPREKSSSREPRLVQ